MIEVFRQGEKLIGTLRIYVDNKQQKKDDYISNSLYAELMKDDNSGLFTYDILDIQSELNADFFGKNYVVIFEFVPNKELVTELILLSERLEVGL